MDRMDNQLIIYLIAALCSEPITLLFSVLLTELLVSG